MSTRTTKSIWGLVNTVLVVVAFWTGYNEISPENLRGTNPDQYLCLSLLLAMPLGVVLLVCFPRRETLERPSWGRTPLFLGRDPLQGVFLTTVTVFGYALGSSLGISGAGAIGRWTVAIWWSTFVGLVLGQVIVYIVYRGRITRTA